MSGTTSKRVGAIVAICVVAGALAVFGITKLVTSLAGPRDCSTEVQTDPAPVIKAVPALGTPAEIHWQELAGAADATCQRLPYPDPWTDVVVRLAPETAAEWRDRAGWAPGNPTIPETLDGYVPEGASWQRNEALAAELFADTNVGVIFMDLDRGLVYFRIVY